MYLGQKYLFKKTPGCMEASGQNRGNIIINLGFFSQFIRNMVAWSDLTAKNKHLQSKTDL